MARFWSAVALWIAICSKNAGAAPDLPAVLPDTDLTDGDYMWMAEFGEQTEPSLPPIVETPPRSAKQQFDHRSSAMKVLVVGDSMTQGAEGDWTWRYRIWEWFKSQDISIEFVGPYTGTNPPAVAAPPPLPALQGSLNFPAQSPANGSYAKGISPEFLKNTKHFAIWGRACAQDVSLIHDVVVDAQPDLILSMLGFNDMGWRITDGKGTFACTTTLVERYRLAKPGVKLAVANVPERTKRVDLARHTDEYNKLLAEAIPVWSTPESPVQLVKLRENYDCSLKSCPVGYDGIHPNALGEYQIAHAFSIGLVEMGIGHSALSIPKNIPPRLTPVPSNVKFATSPRGATATWDKVYGAYGYNVKYREKGGSWTTIHSAMNRFDVHWAIDGTTYEFQVNAACGDNCASDWTEVQSAVARPETPPPPRNLIVKELLDGKSVELSWKPPTGKYSEAILEYNVFSRDMNVSVFSADAGFKSSPAVLENLTPGHMYAFSVTAWNVNGEGLPLKAPNRVLGAGSPPSETDNPPDVPNKSSPSAPGKTSHQPSNLGRPSVMKVLGCSLFSGVMRFTWWL